LYKSETGITIKYPINSKTGASDSDWKL